MAASATSRDYKKIVFLCIAWYLSSSAGNVVGKIILTDFPYPMTVSMVQLASISIYVIPFLKLWDVPSANRIHLRYWFTMILPLAFGKFFSSVSSHISLWKVPVSYAHTVKATMPLFTVLLSRFLLHEVQTTKVYLSLLPIVLGVCIATVTELSFDAIGLISALVATLGFSLQNIFSKKCLKDTGIHHMRLLALLAQLSAIAFIPLWLYYDFSRIWADTSLSFNESLHDELLQNSPHSSRLLALLVIDGACNFAQNLIAFTVISLISSLSYSVANATKRIIIIAVSLISLRNPVTLANLMGMLTAVLGVLIYNKAKYDQNQAKLKETVLPVYSETNGMVNGWKNQSGHQEKDHSSILLQNSSNYNTQNIYLGSENSQLHYSQAKHHTPSGIYSVKLI